MPQKTLVMAPQKMAAFYSQHNIECEAVSFLGMLNPSFSYCVRLTKVQKYFEAGIKTSMSDCPSCMTSSGSNITWHLQHPDVGRRCLA